MSKLLSITDAALTASAASLAGIMVLTKATALTKREGGVKSPGNPSMPLPAPKGASETPSMLCGAACGVRLGIVPQVQEMPVITGRVGHGADLVVGHAQLPVHVLDDDRGAGRVAHDVMQGQGRAELLFDLGVADHVDLRHC